MAWRVAKSLLVLRDQINALAPNRDKSADGTIGDAAHAATKSEHNPDGNGVVRAMDITNDPASGVVSDKIAHALTDSRDPRILYVISNAQIAASYDVNGVPAWSWRKYTGKNPHDHHFHVSVVAGPALYDLQSPWRLDGVKFEPVPGAKKEPERPLLHFGSSGDDVKYIQAKLLDKPGEFGWATDAVVREFQRRKGLVVDGKVGKYTRAAIDA